MLVAVLLALTGIIKTSLRVELALVVLDRSDEIEIPAGAESTAAGEVELIVAAFGKALLTLANCWFNCSKKVLNNFGSSLVISFSPNKEVGVVINHTSNTKPVNPLATAKAILSRTCFGFFLNLVKRFPDMASFNS